MCGHTIYIWVVECRPNHPLIPPLQWEVQSLAQSPAPYGPQFPEYTPPTPAPGSLSLQPVTADTKHSVPLSPVLVVVVAPPPLTLLLFPAAFKTEKPLYLVLTTRFPSIVFAPCFPCVTDQ